MKATPQERGAGVWSVGPHLVAHGRIDGPALQSLLVSAGSVPVMYTDPPWGDQMMRYFATMAAKTGAAAPPQMAFADLLARLAQIVDRHVRGAVFIEMGNKQAEQVAAAVRPVVSRLEILPATYTMGGVTRPSSLIVGWKELNFAPPVDRPGALDMVVNCLNATGITGTVLDPCCGLGYTARAAMKCGWTFYGNEFNRARLDRTLGFLSRGTRA